MKKTRKEHLECCKKRALEYIDKDSTSALASFVSDMNKHEETRKQMNLCGFMILIIKTKDDTKKFIEGFN